MPRQAFCSTIRMILSLDHSHQVYIDMILIHMRDKLIPYNPIIVQQGEQ